MKIRPLSDQIFCERVYVTEQKTKSGLILVTEEETDDLRDTVYGRVVAVGPGKQVDGTGPINHGIKEGDIVIYVENAVLKYKYLTQVLDMMPASFIRAIIEDVEVTTEEIKTNYGKVSNIQELG